LVDYDPDAWARIESEGLGGFTGVTPFLTDIFRDDPVTAAAYPGRSRDLSRPFPLPIPLTRTIPPKEKHEWYAVDCAFGGPEVRRWAGVTYESQGGGEVGKMVKSLWDERGWECVWVSQAVEIRLSADCHTVRQSSPAAVCPGLLPFPRLCPSEDSRRDGRQHCGVGRGWSA
jgi:hypothetical protein